MVILSPERHNPPGTSRMSCARPDLCGRWGSRCTQAYTSGVYQWPAFDGMVGGRWAVLNCIRQHVVVVKLAIRHPHASTCDPRATCPFGAYKTTAVVMKASWQAQANRQAQVIPNKRSLAPSPTVLVSFESLAWICIGGKCPSQSGGSRISKRECSLDQIS